MILIIMKTISKKIFAIMGVILLIVVSFWLSNIRFIVTERVVEPVKFQTITKYDDARREGTSVVEQEGKDGSREITYRVSRNISGREVQRESVDVRDIHEVQDEIIIIGTKKYYTCSNGTEYDNESAKNECDKRVSWEKGRAQALAECNADSSKTNCWYDDYPGTYVHWTEPRTYTYTPAPGPSSSYRSGAICNDGTTSRATGRGACSHHGGVSRWI